MIKDLTGLTVSVPLFFQKNEEIDYETLERYLEDVCANKMISAVYSMAYNTRYRMLTDSELLEVNRFIITKVKSYGHKVYVGHPYIFNRRTLSQYLDEISDAEPDGISMLYPERYYAIADPIIDFMKMPLKFGLNVVLHEMKLVSGFDGVLVDWPDELLRRVICEVPLVAIKEDSKDDEVAQMVLDMSLEHDFLCVLAGGGKVRAERFIPKGLSTWLNGSSMFCPSLIDPAYYAFVHNEKSYKELYLNNVERPFFEKVVSKIGWHLAHKVALTHFGYGGYHERFPHAQASDINIRQYFEIMNLIEQAALDLQGRG